MKRRIMVPLSTIFAVRGGIPRFNQMLCLALDHLAPQLDLEVTVVSQDDTRGHYEQGGAKWKHLEFVPGHGQKGLMREVMTRCLKDRQDLMLIGLLGMTPLGVLALPRLRRGFGFIAHGTEAWKEDRWTRRFAARRAAFAWAVSANTQGRLAGATGMEAGRIHVLPNTLEPYFSRAVQASASEDTTEAGEELLTVARLWATQHKKGVDHAIRAFADVLKDFPGATYRIVGKGEDKPRLREIASSLGIDQRVHFEEDLSDDELAARYRRCSMFVLPSGQEGFGIVFLEAMQFEKPCIGGNAGGTPEVVDDGVTGILVPFGDEGALAAAMKRLLGDRELRRSYGRAGRQRLLGRFIFERYCDRLGSLLSDCLG